MNDFIRSRGLDPAQVLPEWKLRVERNRVLFPLLSYTGKELGWSGRALTPGTIPKYLNTAGYPRKMWLYGLQQERRTLPIIVEGQVDAIALWALGFTCYAVMGSQLSLVQAAHIAGMSDVCVIYPDQPKDGAAILAEEWSKPLARLGVTSVFPPNPFPPGTTEADPAWLVANELDYVKDQIDSAMQEAERWRRFRL